MNQGLEKQQSELHRRHRRKRRWRNAVSVLAAVTVFATTYALILPAITLERPSCGQEEHAHDESCYEEHRSLTCGLEEDPGHTHDESCYAEDGSLLCGQEERPGHTHTEACYTTEPVLACGREEHVHSGSCWPAVSGPEAAQATGEEEESEPEEPSGDPTADLESSAQWESTFAHLPLTGDWAKDVLSIADTQLGYTESARNFITGDGRAKGYTRYGAWYGSPYGDWCAMFVSFCQHYAGVDPDLLPTDANCQNWIETLSKEEWKLYHRTGKAGGQTTENEAAPESDLPAPGDLIFFDWEEDGISDHVGLVYELINDEDGTPVQVRTIEGNSSDRVQYVQYALTDPGITGYAELPENPNPPKNEESTEKVALTASAENGVAVTLTAPEDAFDVPAEELTLSAEPIKDETMQSLVEEQAAPAEKDRTIRRTVLFDIKVLYNGKEVQPKKPVSLSFSGIKTPNADAQVFHIDERAETAEDMQAEMDENGEISITTDGFSPYGITYTVDFHNGEVVFSIPGGSGILLSELFVQLGIERVTADVVSVVFSDPELVKVEEKDGDWLLISIAPFDTEETLTITFNDGEVYIIRVTDPPVFQGTAAQKVLIGSSNWNFAASLPMSTVVLDLSKINLSNAVIESTGGVDLQIGNMGTVGNALYFTGSLTAGQTYAVPGAVSVRFADAAILSDGSRSDVIETWSGITFGNPVGSNTMKYFCIAFDGDGTGAGQIPYLIDMNHTSFDAAMNKLSPDITGHISISVEQAGAGDTYMAFLQDLDPSPWGHFGHYYESILNISNAATKAAASGDSVLRFRSTDTDYLANGLTAETPIAIPGNPYTHKNSFAYLSYANAISFDFISPVTLGASSYGAMAPIGAKPQYKAYQPDGSLSDWIVNDIGGGISYTDLSVSPNETVQWDNVGTDMYERRGAAFGKNLRLNFGAKEGFYTDKLTQTVNGSTSTLPVGNGVVHINATQAEILFDTYYLPIMGSVIITKTDAETGDPLTGAVFTATGTSSIHGAFTLTSTDNGDGTYTIANVPYGKSTDVYTISETSAPANYFAAPDQTVTGDQFAVNGAKVLLSFEDPSSIRSLTITKTVIGSSTTRFPFEVLLTDANGDPVQIPEDPASPKRYEVSAVSPYQVTFSLAGGESVMLSGIPVGTTATITETNHDGYTVLIKDTTAGGTTLSNTDTAAVTVTRDQAVEVINNPGVMLPSAGGGGRVLFFGGGAALLLCALLLGLRLVRGREKGG